MKNSGKMGLAIASLVGATGFVLFALNFGEDNNPKQDFSGSESWPFFAFIYGVSILFCYMSSLLIGYPLLTMFKPYSIQNIGVFLVQDTINHIPVKV